MFKVYIFTINVSFKVCVPCIIVNQLMQVKSVHEYKKTFIKI